MNNIEILYRYEPYFDELVLRQYLIIKETPKGYWILLDKTNISEKKRWVSKFARKRFAYPTKDEAWFNFKKRNGRHIKLLNDRLQFADYCAKLNQEDIKEI